MNLRQLPYGDQQLDLDLTGFGTVDWIEPAFVPGAPDPREVVRSAIHRPVGGRQLSEFAGVSEVAIAINDKTRPVPHDILLPPLLDALEEAGIALEAVRFYIATGTHLPMPPEEYRRVLPADVLARVGASRVVSHNCDDADNLVHLGQTSRGTPVWVNKLFHAAGLRIAVGNIEPHHFAGFSGGYKTVAIGLSGRQSINHNHAMLVDPGARIGNIAANPLRQDIEEIGDQIGVHFALNAILNGQKEVVQAVFGAPRAVMQAGVPLSQAASQIHAGKGYDLVIASAGGAPKDINFYQAQKALTHASLFARDGGVIVLAAACPEGSGSKSYEAFMQGVATPDAVFEKFRRLGFQVGPHKAFQVARDASRVRIILLSQIPADLVSRLLMIPASSLPDALSKAALLLAPLPAGAARAAVLPRATNTIPVD